jgi:hypothetical protein
MLFDKETMMGVMKFEMNASWTSENNLKIIKYKKLWIFISQGLLMNLMQTALMFSLAPLFTDLEPSFFVLKIFFPEKVKSSSWALRILRSLWNGLLGLHWTCCFETMVFCAICVMNMIVESLHTLVYLSSKCHIDCLDRKQIRGLLKRKLIFSYRHLIMIVEAVNSITRWVLAVSIGCGMGTFVFGGTGTVLLAGKVNVTTFIVFPLLALIVVCLACFMAPRGGQIDTFSSEFISSFKKNGLERHPFRISRSMKPLRIEAGSFYYFSRLSVVEILFSWVDNCITVLLCV